MENLLPSLGQKLYILSITLLVILNGVRFVTYLNQQKEIHVVKKTITIRKENCEFKSLLEIRDQNVTLILAYYRIQSQQGNDNDTAYMQWMRGLAYIRNPVLLYTDDLNIARNFKHLRQPYGLATYTAIIILSQDSLWSFKLLPDVEQYYSSRIKYHHHIQTSAYKTIKIISKLNFIEHAISKNYFEKSNFMWLDIDYISNVSILNGNESYNLNLPSSLAVNEVGTSMMKNESAPTTLTGTVRDLDLLKGGIYAARSETFSAFCQYFKNITRMFSSHRTNTEQSISIGKKKSLGFKLQFYNQHLIHQMVKRSHCE